MIVNKQSGPNPSIDARVVSLQEKLSKGYANAVGEFEMWKTNHAAIIDDDMSEDLKLNLEHL